MSGADNEGVWELGIGSPGHISENLSPLQRSASTLKTLNSNAEVNSSCDGGLVADRCVSAFDGTGVAKDGDPALVPGARVAQVTPDVDPFVEGDAQRVEAVDIGSEAVHTSFLLGFKAAEHAVPDDENAGVIAVNVLRVGGVMDAMVRRRIHHPLKGAESIHQFGVDPELVQQADGLHGEDHDGLKADEGHPEPEDESKKAAGPGLAQRGGEVVTL